MAFLSVTLKNSVNKTLNLVMAGICFFLNIFHLVIAISLFGLAAYQILVIALTIVAPAIIFVYALKWPEEKVS